MPLMLPDGRRLGVHLPLAGGMVKAVERAHEIGATALQVFSDNPTAWRRRSEPPSELEAFRARLVVYDIAPVAIHASYLVNLAGPDRDLFRRSVELLAHELRVAPTFGARYVNVHIGSHRESGLETGIRQLAEGVALALAQVDDVPGRATLVLENASGSGYGFGASGEELAAIAAALGAAGVPRDRVGFCLDTAHAWGAGIDVGTPSAIDAFLAGFDAAIGLDRLPLVHFNDSRAEFGSRTDRHEHIGAGRIEPTGLAHLLTHPRLGGATYVLETPGMDQGFDAINLQRTLDLAAGRPLDPLPPGALEIRTSDRARSAPPA
jgi:deoxyribonuclease-4